MSAAIDDTGVSILPDSYPITNITRDGAGNILTVTISNDGKSWMQTITRDANGDIATVSRWVRQ